MSESPEALLLVAYSGEDVAVYPLPPSGQVSIGRGEGNDVVLKDGSASRRHCVLHVTAPMSIEDLGGPNGTFVGAAGPGLPDETRDLRQVTGATVPVGVGDRVTVGSTLLVVRHAAAAPTTSTGGGVVITDARMRALYQQVDRAAQALINVLVLGETGVGKEILARSVHERSARAAKPFLSLNCAALSESLLEAELFGHEKGSFTGAVSARPGLFESVDGGSVFLDEIGELPNSTQVKLLRVLEERKVLRVGGRTPRSIDVRFIAATNRDLEAEVDKGAFRQDLYFRLNAFSLFIPPLRERRDEIAPLARLFAETVAKQLDRREIPTFSAEAAALLEVYDYPGNVRELKNVVERAVVLCAGRTIMPEHLPTKIALRSVRGAALAGGEPPRSRPAPVTSQPESDDGTSRPSSEPMARVPAARASDSGAASESAAAAAGDDRFQGEIRALERQRIVDALDRCAGNQTRAAEALGVSRRTLSTWLERYKIPRPRKREGE